MGGLEQRLHESLCFDADAEGAVVKSLDKTTTYGDIIERMELDTTVSDEIKASCEKCDEWALV